MTLLAHAGHWLVNVAYFAPVAGFLGWLAWTELRGHRQRRAQRQSSAADQPTGTGSG